MASVNGVSSGNQVQAVRRVQGQAPTAAPAAVATHNATATARQLAAAPSVSGTQQTNALSVIPTDWIPMGSSDHAFKAKSGIITAAKGSAHIDRTATSLSIRSRQANITMQVDPSNPNRVRAHTPKGDFTGTITREGDTIRLSSTDGKKGLTIKNNGDELRLDTKGFGLLDSGHLNVRK